MPRPATFRKRERERAIRRFDAILGRIYGVRSSLLTEPQRKEQRTTVVGVSDNLGYSLQVGPQMLTITTHKDGAKTKQRWHPGTSGRETVEKALEQFEWLMEGREVVSRQKQSNLNYRQI